MTIPDTPLTFGAPARSGLVVPRARGKQMPLEGEAMLKQVSAAKCDIRQGEARTFAPIP